MAKSDVTLVIGKDVADAIRGMTEVVGKMEDIERATRKSGRAAESHKGLTDQLGLSFEQMQGRAVGAIAGLLTIGTATNAFKGFIAMVDDLQKKLEELGRGANTFQDSVLGLASVVDAKDLDRQVSIAVAKGAKFGVSPEESLDISARAISIAGGDEGVASEAREAMFSLRRFGTPSKQAQDIVTTGTAAGFSPKESATAFMVGQGPAALTPEELSGAFPGIVAFRDPSFGLAAVSELSKQGITPERLRTSAERTARAFAKATENKELEAVTGELDGLDDSARFRAIVGAVTPSGAGGKFVAEDFFKRGFREFEEADVLARLANAQDRLGPLQAKINTEFRDPNVLDRMHSDRVNSSVALRLAMDARASEARIEGAEVLGPIAVLGQEEVKRQQQRSEKIQSIGLGAFVPRDSGLRTAIDFASETLAGESTPRGLAGSAFLKATLGGGLGELNPAVFGPEVLRLLGEILGSAQRQQEHSARMEALVVDQNDVLGSVADAAESTAVNTLGGEVVAPSLGAGI